MNEQRFPFEPFESTDDDPIARRLRRALAEEAEMVHPDDHAYEQLTERIAADEPRRPWVPWVVGLAAAAVIGIVVGAAVIGLQDDDEPPVASPSVTQTDTPTPSDTTSPSESAPPTGTVDGVPVYWVGQSKTSFWLYREFREVPDAGSLEASAIAAMTRQEPLDPDYTTPWSPASRVEVSRDGDDLVVDLSADAFAEGVGSEVAELAVQQLVYTATAAADLAGQPASSVTITVDGVAGYDAWGVVRLGEPMQRAPMVDVQASTWILSPTEGETVPAGTVRFTGYGTAFEANFAWEVRDSSGAVVAEGFTTGTGGNGTFGDFSFTADLAPGDYTVEVYQPDASDGESAEGPRLYPDTKDFTVT